MMKLLLFYVLIACLGDVLINVSVDIKRFGFLANVVHFEYVIQMALDGCGSIMWLMLSCDFAVLNINHSLKTVTFVFNK